MHGGCRCKPKPKHMSHGGCSMCGAMASIPMAMPKPMPKPMPAESLPEIDPGQMKVVQEAAEKFIEGLKDMGVAAMDMSVVFSEGGEAPEDDGDDDEENVEMMEE